MDLKKSKIFCLSNHKGGSAINELLDIQATMLLSEYQIEAALELYKLIPRTQWDNYGVFQPFRQVFNDCINCLYPADTSAMYNKGELMEKILDLEYKSRGETDNRAPYFYELGLVYYNTSFFGYAWNVMDYFRSGTTWRSINKGKDGVFQHWQCEYGNRDHLDVTKALYYFEKARLFSLNPELTARASFMIAKCEQKMYFTSDEYRRPACYDCIPEPPAAYLTGFRRLKEDLAETAFYEEIIEECQYFRAFAAQ